MRRYKVSLPVSNPATGGYKRSRVTVTVDAESDADAIRLARIKRSEEGHTNTLPNAIGQRAKILASREIP